MSGAKMKSPWFRANTVSTTMGIFEAGHLRRPAPLAEGERALGWFVLPPFQRPPVWTEAQKIRFIESAWGGLPLGVFIYNRPDVYAHPFENYLLDGQQRVTAVLDYMADKFPVLGYRWSELDVVDHRKWTMTTSFSSMETHLTDLDAIKEVYDRLAYGGTPHEPKPTEIDHHTFRDGDELVVRARFKESSDEFAAPHIWVWPVEPKDVISHKPKGDA